MIKIDLEVDDPKFQIPAFPVSLGNVFQDNPSKRTDDQQKFVDHPMKNYFSKENQFRQ